MKKTINIDDAANLKPGDFLTVHLRAVPETVISGKVIIDDSGRTHISGYGWIDVARHKFVSATREVETTPEVDPGTLGKAVVSVSNSDLKVWMRGVVDRFGNFHWAGKTEEGIARPGQYKDFTPITFGELSNAHDRAIRLEEKLRNAGTEAATLREKRDELQAESNEYTELKMDLSALKSINGLERSLMTKEATELRDHFTQINYEEQAVVLPTFLEIAGAVGQVLYEKNRWILGAPSKVDVGDAVLDLLKKKMTVLTVGDLATFIEEVMQADSIVGDPMSIAEGVYERLGLMKGNNYGS